MSHTIEQLQSMTKEELVMLLSQVQAEQNITKRAASRVHAALANAFNDPVLLTRSWVNRQMAELALVLGDPVTDTGDQQADSGSSCGSVEVKTQNPSPELVVNINGGCIKIDCINLTFMG